MQEAGGFPPAFGYLLQTNPWTKHPEHMTTAYETAFEEVMAEIEDIDPASSPRIQSLFTFFSANVLHYMPVIPYRDHLQCFRACCGYQKLSLLDQRFFGPQFPVKITGWDSHWVDGLRSRPGIICTMHSGSYRLINFMLARDSVPHAILVSSKFKSTQEEALRQLYPRIGLDPTPVHVLDAGKATTPLTMMRLLDRGVNIVVYVDGDVGVPLKGTDKLQRIPFLAQHIHIRKGIARIAARQQAPIYPIFNFRKDAGTINVYPLDAIEPQGRHDQQLFEEQTLSLIYQTFASLLLHHPMQWENWFALHENIDINKRFIAPRFPDQPDYRPENPDYYGIFQHDEAFFLLGKQDYQVMPLNI